MVDRLKCWVVGVGRVAQPREQRIPARSRAEFDAAVEPEFGCPPPSPWGAAAAVVAFLSLALGFGCLRGPQELSREHSARAETWLRAGKLELAHIEYRVALQKDAANAEALFGLARVQERMGDSTEAFQTLCRAVAADPAHTASRLRLGEILLAAGSFSAARESAREVVARDPHNAFAARLEARALAALGEPEPARRRWQALLASPQADAADYREAAALELVCGALPRAIERLREGLRRFPQDGWLHAELGGLLLAEDAREAAALFERAERLSPEVPGVWVARARSLVRQGRLEEGLALLDRAQRTPTDDPGRGAALAAERARLLLEAGEPAVAGQVLEAARAAYPGQPGLAVTLAEVLTRQGRTAEARELVRFAAKVDPTGRQEKRLEAGIYLQEGAPRWAAQVASELAAQGDESVATRLLHARASSQLEEWAEALRLYRSLLAQAPDHAVARLEVAALLLSLGDHRGAAAQVEALPAGPAAAPRLLFLRARVHLAAGDTAGARPWAVRLVREQPESPVASILRGDVERATGNLDQALVWYRAAQALAPSAVEPLFAQADTRLEQGASLNEIRRLFEEHLAAQGETAAVRNRMATYFLAAGDLHQASRQVQRSLTVAPNDWQSRVLSAQLHLAEANPMKAAVELAYAIELNPKSPAPYNLLAEIYAAGGEAERTESTYRRLLEVVPAEPQTCNNLANLYLVQGRAAEAVILARQALEGSPGSPAVLDTLGWALQLAGSPVEASGYLNAARERLPEHPEVLLHWGVNLQSLGQVGLAGEALRRVVAAVPETPVAARAAELLATLPPEVMQ